MQGLLQGSREMITLYKTQKIFKKVYLQTIQNFLTTFILFQRGTNLIDSRKNGELGGFVVLKNVYFKINKKNATQNIPYDYCLTLIRDCNRIDLYFNLSSQINLFLRELQRFSILFQNIGTGSTAQVFLAENIQDHYQYAVKQIEKEQATGRHRVLRSKTLLEEIFMMRSLDHPNIMKLHQVYESEKHIQLVIGLFEGGQLMDKVKNFNFLIKRELTKVLIETVYYMHTKGIMHRDLKSFNILYKNKDPKDWQFGIGDFGFSTSIKEQQHILYKCGTPGYVAMKLQNIEKSLRCMDCHAMCLVFVVEKLNSFFNTHPFKSKTKDDPLRQNVNAYINFDDHVCTPQSLKSKNPRHRFTLQQCLEHDFSKRAYPNLMNYHKKYKSMNHRLWKLETLDIKQFSFQNSKQQKKTIFTLRFLCYLRTKKFNKVTSILMNKGKSILIKHRQSISSTHESKMKLESQQQFQLSQQNQIQMPSYIKLTQLEKICEIFLNDSHYIPKEFGNTYLIKKY